ncbi:TSC22 domain family protein 4-like [Dendropsophus ebraccatus]|uniref:TSC22 domain family protein 4-like n=1 Tax=Dendropsophus ebraccatus TaxID=150705 RepID=UPI003830FCBC
MSGGKKRSGFQITSVTSDYQPSSPISPAPRRALSVSAQWPSLAPTSRFRLVRLDQGPLGGGRRYQKGRWSCVDFYNLEVGGQQQRAGAGHSLDSGLPRSAPASPPTNSHQEAGPRASRPPRSQGAPIFPAGTNKEPAGVSAPVSCVSAPCPVSPRITVQNEPRPNRPVSDVFNERLLLARSVFSIDESESDR